MDWELWLAVGTGVLVLVIITGVCLYCIGRKRIARKRPIGIRVRRPCSMSNSKRETSGLDPAMLNIYFNCASVKDSGYNSADRCENEKNYCNEGYVSDDSTRPNIYSRYLKKSLSDISISPFESLLLAQSDKNFEKENNVVSVSKVIGPFGGRLEVFGVSLTIPKDALDIACMIKLGIVWGQKLMPKLSAKRTILSPIITCEPSRLSFNKPVSLSFPHGAVKPNDYWVLQVMTREGKMTASNVQWEPMHVDESNMFISKKRVSLELNHFTLYTLTGEARPGAIAAKLVHLVAFANKLRRGRFFTPRIFCMIGYQELEKAGNIGTSTELIDIAEMIIEDNEKDVMVELSELSRGWELVGQTTEVLLFVNIWHGLHSHCTFNIRHTSADVSDIVCEFHAYQCGNDNRFAKLKIAKISVSANETWDHIDNTMLKEHAPPPPSPVPSSTTQQKTVSSPLQGCPDDPREDLILELTVLLDPENQLQTDAGDWRDLAAKMGMNVAKLRWLDTQSSKTRLLIDKWISEGRTFDELRRVLIDIKRPDAAEEVLKRLPLVEPSPHVWQPEEYPYVTVPTPHNNDYIP